MRRQPRRAAHVCGPEVNLSRLLYRDRAAVPLFPAGLLEKVVAWDVPQVRQLDAEVKSSLFTQFIGIAHRLPSVSTFAWQSPFEEQYRGLEASPTVRAT